MAKTESNIYLARSADCLELAELSRVAVEYGLRWRWKPSRILSLIRNSESCVVVARSEDASLQGFAAMEFKETYAHLILLATVSRFRRQHIGQGLLKWLEESAQVAGMDHISLEVRTQNSNAVRFYEHLGYSIEQVKTGYYEGKEDAYRMRRDLIDRNFSKRRPS